MDNFIIILVIFIGFFILGIVGFGVYLKVSSEIKEKKNK